jgi:hypothetical protein
VKALLLLGCNLHVAINTSAPPAFRSVDIQNSFWDLQAMFFSTENASARNRTRESILEGGTHRKELEVRQIDVTLTTPARDFTHKFERHPWS